MKMPITPIFLLVLCSFLSNEVVAQKGASTSFEQVIALRNVGTPILSPDGQHTLYTLTSTDWKENGYDTEIWLARNGEEPFQLTRSPKSSSTSAKWSPDGKWIAFSSSRNDKNQIFVIRPNGGEAQQVSFEEDGVGTFEWSPDGKQFALFKQDPESKEEKKRKERFGGWAADDAEYRLSHLWLLDFKPDLLPAPSEMPCYEEKKDSSKKSDCINYPKAVRLTEGPFTISNFDWSPDGKMIAYTRQPNPLINFSLYSDIEVIEVVSKKVVFSVKNPSVDNFAAWSPDSKKILYTSNLNDTTAYYYKNDQVLVADLQGGKPNQLAQSFDEDISALSWNAAGVFFTAYQGAKRWLFRLDPLSGQYKALISGNEVFGGYSFSKDGKTLAYSSSSATTLSEIFKTPVSVLKPVQITQMSKQIASWKTAVSEVIRWKSKDGADIEGVLHKPQNYDPAKKYPLLVMIHGGPTGIDLPQPVPGSVYPVIQWLEKGALVLRVNYRGSAGYGEKFRSLNVRNLGVGDMWDVMSGVDHLVAKGVVDENRMGCMGWSQGGYISAFLTTNTDRFKAISVGAGISNWMTYYVNTDIHPFTRQYLQATPWSDPEIYQKTSPMTNIRNAKTPTLIQHGEFDRRVPIANAYELLQGLQDNRVPAKLVVYKGFGHGITKPKERLAAMWHNWEWFNKYLWGEDVVMGEE